MKQTRLAAIILLGFVGISFLNFSKKSSILNSKQYFDLVRPEFKGEIAYETTAYVAQFWRVVGNTGFNNTVSRVASKLEEAGYVLEAEAENSDRFTYRIEKRPLKNPTWEPIDASLTIVGDTVTLLQYSTNRNMIFQNSSSTPADGLVGEVVFIKDLEALKTTEVKNKIVFAEMSPYKIYKAAIVEGGALGLITYNNPAYLQPEKNRNSIQFRGLPYNKELKPWGIALSFEAKEKLKNALLKGRTKVKVAINTKIYPSEELTVVAKIRGAELPDESLVFSAHIQEPGANDNASGVGAQLEMAMLTSKLVRSKKLDLKRSLTFLWGDEIISTRRFISEKEKRTSKINWGISLDMVGENTSITGGSFLIEKMPDPSAIWTRGEDKHSEWGGRPLKLKDMKPHYLNDYIIDIFKEQGKAANWEVNTNPFEGGSDHTPFLRADIPGLLLWHFTDQFYHTDNDRIDKVSQKTLQNVGTAALVSAYTLLNGDEETAELLLDSTLKRAKSRLRAECSLSLAAIKEGKLPADEIKILKAWQDWYSKSLASVIDLDPTGTKELQIKIVQAQAELENFSRSLIRKLK